MKRSCLIGLLLLAGFAGTIEGCSSDASDDHTKPIVSPPGDPALACKEAELSLTPMRRLSRSQYIHSVGDLLVATLGEDDGADALASLQPTLDSLTVDSDEEGFRRYDQRVSYSHVYGYYDASLTIAKAATEGERLAQLAGECAVDEDADNDESCVRDFVRGFAERAFRRPVSSDEMDHYVIDAMGTADDVSAPAMRERVAVILMAPDFLYLIEDDLPATKTNDDVFPLSGHELASRLAYHFWDAPPDAELLATAAAGKLDSEDGYAEQVDRLLADPRAKYAVGEFVREWMRLEADGATAEMADDVVAAFLHYTWTVQGSFEDLLLSDLSFATDADLAKIYRTEPWKEGTAPPRFGDDARAGLFARAAFVATGGLATQPVRKGLRLREQLLCDTLSAPPVDIPPPPVLDPNATVREQLEEMTEQPETSCAGCHVFINHLGYVTEMFDGLGRYRETEQVFEDGELIAERPIDTVAVPRLVHDDETEVSTPKQLSELISQSGRAHHCAARQYFRFAYGRPDEGDDDTCTVQKIESALTGDGSIHSMLRAVVMQPGFRNRRR